FAEPQVYPVQPYFAGNKGVEQYQQPKTQKTFNMDTDEGKPGGRIGIFPVEDAQALLAAFSFQTFKLDDRQLDGAGEPQASPDQDQDQLTPRLHRKGGQHLPDRRQIP